ncbi:MAG: hypothetical protein EXQ87_12555 [Alphaproteobacteria bacterium]|nr:hypothetical protein [Alphaproteobacteria bacterium]
MPRAGDPGTATEDSDQTAVAAFLADPATHGGQPVERIDTHAAMVFLAGKWAWKLKRAVHLPYLDFSSLEKRRLSCLGELALNRRTVPKLYLGVEAICQRTGGGLAIGGEGRIVDWVVRMRRFEQTALFDRMARAGGLDDSLMVTLARIVAAFHGAAERAQPTSPWGGARARAETVRPNLAELRLAPDWFEAARVETLSRRLEDRLAPLGPLLDRRKGEAWVRRGHGDLHLGNICLFEGRPTPFDGIEFSEALAQIDTLDDVAFLLMDLDHRGLRPLARLFLDRYLLASGDRGGLGALPLFLTDRAMVRAHVNRRIASADPTAAPRLKAEALANLDAAERYLAPSGARLIVVGGRSGTGKSTLARRLADALKDVAAPGALHVRTDLIRKHLFGAGDTDRLPESAYSAAVNARIYASLFDWAGQALHGGHSAIADGVFGDPAERAHIERVARQAGVPFIGFWLEAPGEVLLARVARRRGDASDATEAVVRAQLAVNFGPVAWTTLDASGPADMLAAAAEGAIDRRT